MTITITKLFWTLIAFDCALILLHLLFGLHHTFFYLDTEQNLPTGYQALKALILGSVFVWQGYTNRWRLLQFMGASLMLLGLDEWFVGHENLETYAQRIARGPVDAFVAWLREVDYHSSSWIIFMLPFMVVWGLVWLFFVVRANNFHRQVLFSFAACFSFVLFLELIGTEGKLTFYEYFAAATLEETFELFGISVLVLLLPTRFKLGR